MIHEGAAEHMSNHNIVEGLEPQSVWKYFADLSSIPRCSKHETAAGDFVRQVADRLGLEAERDATGNVIVRKPAASGRETATAVCLQGHLDMVCEKAPAKAHDFSADPISLRRHNGF